MREILRLEAAGLSVDIETHQLRADILDSKGNVLLEPSELTEFFSQSSRFSSLLADLKRFQDKVIPKLQAPALKREDAVVLLPDFDHVEESIIRLGNEVRNEEIRNREETMRSLVRRRLLLWGVLVFSWATIIIWLVTLAKSERKYRRAAEEESAARKRERRAIEAMQEAVRVKSNFLGMVSHELRSQLQNILSSLDVLEQRMFGAGNGELVVRVRRAADALNGQLRDLLTLAKGEAGKLEVRPEAFEAGELFMGVLDLFGEAAEKKGIRLVGHVPNEPVFVVSDPTRISQVLTNLVSNAVKYTEVGQVDVSLHPMPPDRGELRFEVRDTGNGIPHECLPSLFTAYTRFGSSERREGAGIGLAIVRTVLDHLRGSIDVESEEGKGTTFKVNVPVTVPEVYHSCRESAPISHILIVDDRQDVLDSLAILASELGYSCDVAPSADVASNYLADRRYDAVLIDLHMPIKGGHELAAETRQGSGPNALTRLIAISASESRLSGNTWPFDAFLEKPIARSALRKAIDPRTLA
jgi:signal transduction histidine kinase/CheY-like chemotaxis protein